MSLIVTQNISFTLSTRVVENKAYVKYKLTVIIIQKNKIKWIAMILEKIKKKNHRIWSSYEGGIVDTSFNPELKEERPTIHLLFTWILLVIHFSYEYYITDKENVNFPMC